MIQELEKLERVVLDSLSIQNINSHINNLTDETPYRIAGGGQDLKAAQYIQKVMTSYGLEVEMNEFETYNSYPGSGSLRIVSPVEREIQCLACLHIEATPPGGFESELVYVGAGGEDDYLGKDVKGKIVLAEVSYSPATPEKARLAYKYGAIGLVLMNWGKASQPFIPMRALKAVWGNPTPETWEEIPKLYAVTTTRSDGEFLKNLCLSGQVRVCINTTSDRQWGTITQPIAKLTPSNSSSDSEQFIIVSGHLDAWNPGVTDNATGNAVMLEVARVLAQYRDKLRRSVIFCFWNGHEIAEAAGSAYYVDTEWERINRNAVAYLNIDSPGMKDTSYLLINSSPELSLFHGPIEKRILGERGEHFPLARTGDQSFFGIGVPSITGRYLHSQKLVEEWNGATLGWWNHTPEENMDKLDLNTLEKEGKLWGAYILSLASCPVLPQRFTPRAKDFKNKLNQVLHKGESPRELLSLIPLVTSLEEYTYLLDKKADEATLKWEMENNISTNLEKQTHAINQSLLKLSRYLTAINSTVVGRYGQDSYGLSDLDYPIPMLAPLEKYRISSIGSVDRKLLFTKLLRIRNQISDALHNTIDEIKYLNKLLDSIRK